MGRLWDVMSRKRTPGSQPRVTSSAPIQSLIQPIEDAEVADTRALRFTVKVGAVSLSELHQLLWRTHHFVKLLRLARPVNFVDRRCDQERALNFVGDTLQVVRQHSLVSV